MRVSELSVGETVLAEMEAAAWLTDAGVPYVRSVLVTREAELAAAVVRCGASSSGRVVLKAAAAWLIHKSDHALVELDVDAADASVAYRRLMGRAATLGRGPLTGVIVQPRIQGIELILGIRRDPQLGPFIMMGAGGVLVELVDDVVALSARTRRRELGRALHGLRVAALLRGWRGERQKAIEAFIDLAVAVGATATRHPELQELDLNPVIIDTEHATAVDARVVLGPAGQSRTAFRGVGPLLSPSSIAVIGASRDGNKLGSRILRYLAAGGYRGHVTPIHADADRLGGFATRRRLGDIQPTPDLVSVIVPAEQVPAVVAECVALQVPAVVVHSSGIGPDNDGGASVEATVAGARRGRTVICGPNSIGIVSPADRVYAGFAGVLETAPLPSGGISFVSHSGAMGSALISRAIDHGGGIARWISTGNEADLDLADYLAFLAEDHRTRIVIAYVESLRRGPALARAARMLAAARKPLIVYLAGRSEVGRKVIASHTGALASQTRISAAFLDSIGAVRAPTLQSLVMAALVIERQPTPVGARTAIITMSGAAASVCADAAEATGLPLAVLTRATRSELRRSIPPGGNADNPIDVTAAAMTDPERLMKVIKAVSSDRGVDQVLLQLTTNADPIAAVIAEAIARLMSEPRRQARLIVSRLGSPTLAPRAMACFRQHAIPILEWPEEAIATAWVVGSVGERYEKAQPKRRRHQ